MGQNHITSNGIPGRGHIDESLLNTMGQYHGNAPWYHNFRAQKGIRDLELRFRIYTQLRLIKTAYMLTLNVYAGSLHKSSVYIVCIRGLPSQK